MLHIKSNQSECNESIMTTNFYYFESWDFNKSYVTVEAAVGGRFGGRALHVSCRCKPWEKQTCDREQPTVPGLHLWATF